MESRCFFRLENALSNSERFPLKGCPHLPPMHLGIRSIWNLLSAQQVLGGQQLQLHQWYPSFLLHHWDQEDLVPQQSPS